jgi:hypothetical protein
MDEHGLVCGLDINKTDKLWTPQSVSVKMRLRAGRSGVQVSVKQGVYLLSKLPTQALGPKQHHIQCLSLFFSKGYSCGCVSCSLNFI